MVYKFIDEGKREHKEMRAFIIEFRLSNELLFKERNNSLSELRFEVHGCQKLRKEKEEAQQRKFLENLKQQHINFPFIEALAQMPKYAKFVKGFLTNKARLEEACIVTMNERCLTVSLNKLPSKEKEPGSFTIPYDIGHLHINNALADLGASISLMPYTMYEKLFLREPKPTRMSLQICPSNMPEDSRVLIILGRPFFATARSMIDVFNKMITLRVEDDEVIFDLDQSIKRPPAEDDECYDIDDLDDTINIETQELLENDQSDSFLLKGLEKSIYQSDLESCNSIGNESYENFDFEMPIWRIDSVNTPYFDTHKTTGTNGVNSEQLYSASANEIDEKKPKLKDLPNHLEYTYQHVNKSLPIIISSKLSEKEKMLLLRVLEKRKGEITWKMSDIKGIIQDVVKNEIVKLLDSGLIYPISDSSWVSPIHFVPKKGGMNVVLNDNNKLIPSRTVTGWRVCIDYRKLNDATRKDHFPLLFID
nr:DNA-directed DNA polymerase [Tanacetum cinerariifolium]